MATRLTLHTFKHKKRKVSTIEELTITGFENLWIKNYHDYCIVLFISSNRQYSSRNSCQRPRGTCCIREGHTEWEESRLQNKVDARWTRTSWKDLFEEEAYWERVRLFWSFVLRAKKKLQSNIVLYLSAEKNIGIVQKSEILVSKKMRWNKMVSEMKDKILGGGRGVNLKCQWFFFDMMISTRNLGL